MLGRVGTVLEMIKVVVHRIQSASGGFGRTGEHRDHRF
jgi:hypothetical protein